MNNLQQKVKDFCNERKLNSPIEYRMLDLTSEIGELSKEVLIMTDYGSKPLTYRTEFKSEFGDVLYSLLTVANYFSIDIDEALNETLSKYEKRIKKSGVGTPGSWQKI